MAMPPFPFDAVNDFFSQLSLPISLCLLFAIDKKKAPLPSQQESH